MKFFFGIRLAILLVLALLIFGTLGYMLIEGYPFLDAVYMTVITITTIGYGETHPLSSSGRVFTIVLIFVSFGTFAYAVSSISNYILSGKYRTDLIEKHKKKLLKNLNNHIIVCGYGRVGKKVVETLLIYHKKIVVIDQENFTPLNDQIVFIQGNATDDEFLIQAEIKNAQSVITTLPSDADNLMIVVSAKSLNSKLEIVSRSSDSRNVIKLKNAGAQKVIMPDTLGGQHMAQLLVRPDLIEFLDQISELSSADVNLEEVSFNELPSNFKHKTIGELNSDSFIGCTIVGFKNESGQFFINPSPNTTVVTNSKLFVLGTKEQISKLNNVLKQSL